MPFRLKSTRVKLTENHVEKQALDLLGLYGLNHHRLHAGLYKTADNRWLSGEKPGTPDYCVPRFYIETKRPGAKLSPEQVKKIEELKLIWNLDTAVVSDADELLAWLKNHNIEKL